MLRSLIYKIKYALSTLILNLKGASIGRNTKMHFPIVVSPNKLRVGERCYIGPQGSIYARGGVYIGDGTIIGPRVIIHSSNHIFNSPSRMPYEHGYNHKAVSIGRGVWIGDSVIIAPGTVIPDGCIIGAGSVVRGALTPYAIYFGNPASLIKIRTDVDKCVALIKNSEYYIK